MSVTRTSPVAIFVGLCVILAAPQAQARQIPITVDGEIAGSLASRRSYTLSTSSSDMQTQFLRGGIGAGGVGGGASVYIGLGDDQESTNFSLKSVELGLSYRTLGSFSGKAADGTEHTGSLSQFMLAPGVRYRYTGFVVQPMFALHAGWFPTSISVSDSTDLSQSYFGTFGLQGTLGVQFGIGSRVALGVGASIMQLWTLADKGGNFVRWRGVAMLTVVGGNP